MAPSPRRRPVRDRTAELWLEPAGDIESIATVNAIALLLSTVHEIERGRAEREQRLTLWPIDDTPLEDGQAVVGGRMRELMTYAKRIATTNVSVLLTGESGTGKEILARAVHNYSDRADKPFIPFNCAAIPREMLESQLFGHRRGAFTGADRDNPGVIRAARGGTLFLDEIGELSLDLQPKLLRFLESGEICPLGESTPFTVDVRVIAATNANLEHGRQGTDGSAKTSSTASTSSGCRSRRSASGATKSPRSCITSSPPPRPNTGKATCGSPKTPWSNCCSSLARQHPAAPQRNPPDGRARRAGRGAHPQRAVRRGRQRAARQPATARHRMMAPRGEKLRPVLDRIECEMIKVALRDHRRPRRRRRESARHLPQGPLPQAPAARPVTLTRASSFS